ncbi:MAG TPA: hypothetical protein VFJ78_00250 [Gaiellaceae bacterium]|nr:hypothetical protein [Gaiellaceae bacterium]
MHQSRKPFVRTATALLIAVSAVVIGAVFGTASLGRAASSAAPSNTSPPTISGTAQEGSTLTADHGTWTGSPTGYSYQYQRCDKNGGSCAGISGADRRLYDLRSADVGHTLRVRVTAKNADGSGSDTSVPTAVVTAKPAAPAPTGCPSGTGTIQISQLTPPANLAITTFSSNPQVLGRQVGTLSITAKITACGNRPVQGALVYAAAVPFNQFTVAPEAQTDANGMATLSEPQLSGYPASSRQQLLAVFIRARKAGEPQGQGVATSRLVSFKVNLHQ